MTSERVHADAYRANLKAGLQVLKGAAHAVALTTTTPFGIDVKKPPIIDGGINMSCVLEYNVIAKGVAAEVGASVIDLYGYVEEFCQQQKLLPASSGFGGNYTACAIQSSGLHFFTSTPQPSGQQYTGLHIAAEATMMIPNAHINNKTEGEARVLGSSSSSSMPDTMSCGNPPAPLSTTLPNVLIIGDSISEPGSGYGPGVQQLLMRPGVPWRNVSGSLAAVQHNGNTGSNQAGPTTNGVNCIKSWVGKDYKWDVITVNFGVCMCACMCCVVCVPCAAAYPVRAASRDPRLLPAEGERHANDLRQKPRHHLRSGPCGAGPGRQDPLGLDHAGPDRRRRRAAALHLRPQRP